jgi:hypothetical protein
VLDRLWQLSYDSALIDVVRNSQYAVPLIQSVHLFGITLLLAATVIFNVRQLRLGLCSVPAADLARETWRWSKAGLCAAVASGFIVFVLDPARYAANTAFLTKMGFLAAASLAQFTWLRRAARFPDDERRVALPLLSLTLWFCVGWAGRAIAFLG